MKIRWRNVTTQFVVYYFILMLDFVFSENNYGWTKTTASQKSCYIGAYKVDKPPYNSCAGYRYCEPGYFCRNEAKIPCPAGRYGSSSASSNSSCDGPCANGHFCHLGSDTATANECGSPNLYCPEGSVYPLDVPEGFYSIDANGEDSFASINTRSSIKICPKGSYCQGGIKYICPVGSYGDTEGLSNPRCTGECPAGWYCPLGSTNPHQFPCSDNPTIFCPIGLSHILRTFSGYYAIESHRVEGGGYGGQLQCPAGSYCVDGVKYDCPGGHYGDLKQEIRPNCSGICQAGYYCPPGSTNRKQHACGNSSQYCPEGSAYPTPVSVGYYTTGSDLDEPMVIKVNVTEEHLQLHRTSQKQCEPGYYCSADGIRRKCSAGKWGNKYGMTSSHCEGICEAGYYCPEGSTSPYQVRCGSSDVYCPRGSGSPQSVQTGYYTVGGVGNTTREAERKCEPGFYCLHGIKKMCDPGYFGSTYGLTSSTCTSTCSPGYYCPLGSMQGVEVMCGDPNRYCPEGSHQPIKVPPGYYSTGGNESTRFNIQIAPRGYFAFNGLLYKCRAGYYGATAGLSSPQCSGACTVPGYYCPAGSVSPTMRVCGGDSYYCTSTTVAPIRTPKGFYTADYLYESCPPGRFRNSSKSIDVTLPDGQSDFPTHVLVPPCDLCPSGTYKSVVGDDYSLCKSCDSRYGESSDDRTVCNCLNVLRSGYVPHFNITSGKCVSISVSLVPYITHDQWSGGMALTRYQPYPCEPGHYCIDGLRYNCPPGYYGGLTLETRPTCQGLCAAGYFCPETSISPLSKPCGAAEFICPEGSQSPLRVPPGYYSNEDAPENMRSWQIACPPGHYCPGDGKRYQCPPGTYSDAEGVSAATCMGPCDKGYYCPKGSVSRRLIACGNSTVYCPEGSAVPKRVHDGFYCEFSGGDAGKQAVVDPSRSTCSVEIPCEPGHYCVNGLRYTCPPGRFGWRYGMNSSECGGLCAPGYYCPSTLSPQPDAPPHTLWPMKPHISAAELECGGAGFYCPRGSKYPLYVSGGYYSIGGGSRHNNLTRSEQRPCPPGSYCQGGISILCPRGYYGNQEGLSDILCTGICPAGYYCPPGTAEPIACPEGTFSIGMAYECSPCPGGKDRKTNMVCKNQKSCCFRGM